MKNKKFVFIGIICLIIIFVVIVAFWSLSSHSILDKKNKVLYKITYEDENIPGNRYEIKIFEDEINITETKYCTVDNCKNLVREYQQKFSKSNMNKLKKIIEKNASKILEKTISPYKIDKYLDNVINGIINGEKNFEVAIEEYKYRIEYLESDKLNYEIYFKENGTIIVKKLNIVGNHNIEKIETYEVIFSEENMKNLYDYAKSITVNEENNFVVKSEFSNSEIYYILSIVKNDEKYLKNINSNENSNTSSIDSIN